MVSFQALQYHLWHSVDYFICNALGFVATAFFISSLSTRVGRAWTLMSSSAVLIVANAAIVATPPFPVICASWALPRSCL
jgi:hypothetical protein